VGVPGVVGVGVTVTGGGVVDGVSETSRGAVNVVVASALLAEVTAIVRALEPASTVIRTMSLTAPDGSNGFHVQDTDCVVTLQPPSAQPGVPPGRDITASGSEIEVLTRMGPDPGVQSLAPKTVDTSEVPEGCTTLGSMTIDWTWAAVGPAMATARTPARATAVNALYLRFIGFPSGPYTGIAIRRPHGSVGWRIPRVPQSSNAGERAVPRGAG
jgi:hypothetical protein